MHPKSRFYTLLAFPMKKYVARSVLTSLLPLNFRIMVNSSSIFLTLRSTGGDIELPEFEIDTKPPSGVGKKRNKPRNLPFLIF